MITFIVCLWCLLVIAVSFKYGSHERQMEARLTIKRFEARHGPDHDVDLEQYFGEYYE